MSKARRRYWRARLALARRRRFTWDTRRRRLYQQKPKGGKALRQWQLNVERTRRGTRRWMVRERIARRKLDRANLPRGHIGATHFTWPEMLARSGYTSTRQLSARQRRAVERHAANLERMRKLINIERASHRLDATGINIISGLRSPEKNREIGGASQSRHLNGDATDISREEIARLCPWPGGRDDFERIVEHVFARGGVGWYPSGSCHVDSRGQHARWTSF